METLVNLRIIRVSIFDFHIARKREIKCLLILVTEMFI